MPVTLQDVKEDSTYQVTGTFKDEADVALAAATLTTVKMWLTDHKNVVINTRTAVDILNAGPGAVDSNGLLTLVLVPADNPIVGSDIIERHLLVIEWTWSAGNKKSHENIFLMVVNDGQVPTA